MPQSSDASRLFPPTPAGAVGASTGVLSTDKAQYGESLPGYVRLAVCKDQVWLALREVEEHLPEVAVRPREPWACVLAIIDGDGFMDQAETASVLYCRLVLGGTLIEGSCARLRSCRESSGFQSRCSSRRWPKCGTSARGAKHQHADRCEKDNLSAPVWSQDVI